MKALYTQKSVMRKLTEAFSAIFSEETNPTKQHLFHLLLSVLTLNEFQSVQFQFDHFMKISSDFKLKSYYYTLNESKIVSELPDCFCIRHTLEVGLQVPHCVCSKILQKGVLWNKETGDRSDIETTL